MANSFERISIAAVKVLAKQAALRLVKMSYSVKASAFTRSP